MYQETMALKILSKRVVATQSTQHESSHAAEQESNKLSYLPLNMPAFDSKEFPQDMLMGVPAPYKGSKFPPETFILQCEI